MMIFECTHILRHFKIPCDPDVPRSLGRLSPSVPFVTRIDSYILHPDCQIPTCLSAKDSDFLNSEDTLVRWLKGTAY